MLVTDCRPDWGAYSLAHQLASQTFILSSQPWTAQEGGVRPSKKRVLKWGIPHTKANWLSLINFKWSTGLVCERKALTDLSTGGILKIKIFKGEQIILETKLAAVESLTWLIAFRHNPTHVSEVRLSWYHVLEGRIFPWGKKAPAQLSQASWGCFSILRIMCLRESSSWTSLGYRSTLFFIKQNRMEAGTKGMGVGESFV